jgi:MHS family proline/betaine transporter-like MFS transporter
MTAAIALTVLSVPLFILMGADYPWASFVSTFGLAFILAIILGTHAATVVELFPTRTRQTGLSIAYALTAALFAGTAPYILTWLIDSTGSTLSPGWFLAVVGVIGIVTVASLPETRGIDLLKSDDLEDAENPSVEEPGHGRGRSLAGELPSAQRPLTSICTLASVTHFRRRRP